jgi:hypothetical protein
MKPQIVNIKRVKNNRLQAEMIDIVDKPGKVNVLAKLNHGDSAFERQKPRHAWIPVTSASLIDLGVKGELLERIENLKFGESVECQIIEPRVEGQRLRIQIVETTTPTAWEAANFKKAAKQIKITVEVANNRTLAKHERTGEFIGDIGYFVTDANEYIFSNATVNIESQLEHKFIEGYLVPASLLEDLGTTLAEPLVLGAASKEEAMTEEEQEATSM